MPIDANIVNGLRPIQINDPLQQAGNVLALQGGMARNKLLGLQTQAAEQEFSDKAAIRSALTDPSIGGDYSKAANALLQKGLYKPAMDLRKSGLEERKTQATISKDEAETSLKHLGVLGGVLSPLANKPDVSTDDLINALSVAKAAGVPETTLRNIAQSVPQNAQLLPQFVQRLAMMTDHGLKSVQAMMPKVEKVDNGSQIGFVNTNPLAGDVGTQVAGSPTIAKTATPGEVMTDARTRSEGAANRGVTLRGQNMTDSRMRDANANAIDPTIQGNLAGARARATETAQNTVKAEFSLPAARASRDRAITQVDELLKHPGFESTVGATLAPGMRFVPGSKQADFQARFDQIKGGAFLEAFNVLKGGGQITEIEGKKATDAINRMQLAQSEKEFKLAADDFKNAVRSGFAKLEAQASGKPAAANGGWSIQRVD
jgi:hypothetical protein